jgi:hypothetical protein
LGGISDAADEAAPPSDFGRLGAVFTMLLIFATLGALASGANWPMDAEQRTILLVAAGLGLLGAISGLATAMLRRPQGEASERSAPLVERLHTLANTLATQVSANQTTLLRTQDHSAALLAALVQADQRLQRAAAQAEQHQVRQAGEAGSVPPAAMTEAMLRIADITTRTARQVERLERVLPELLQALTVMHGESAPQPVFDRLATALTQAEAISTASERVGGQMATLPGIAARFEDLHVALAGLGEQMQAVLQANLTAAQPQIGTLAEAVLAIANRIETLNLRVETASGAIGAAGDGIASTASVLSELTDETLPRALFETAEATQLMNIASAELARQLGVSLREIPDELSPVLSRVRASTSVVGGAGSDASRMQQIEEWRERHARKTQERMAILRRQATGEREPEPNEPPVKTAPILLKNLQMTIGQMQSMAAALAADSEPPGLRPEIGVQIQR